MQLLEHIHINVDSILKTTEFLHIATPDLTERGGGNDSDFGPWIHIGNDELYIALTEVPGCSPPDGLRHIGIAVEDIEALMDRLSGAGFEPADASELDSHPFRRRVYYVDGNGIDWEFVEYLSYDSEKRNDYSL
ncbi:MAG: VOC family protein [Gammaproteobacteria bacterium]|jgi:catechol 2,3-dioxygenase-like lactoylglutathione lyase family enzyme|nr:VOC family protein [Gammaproteobacteria bacterium]MDP7456042.1 VOC family protein [Gammaproteobacteria bacterium]|tara:strand:- start:1742 stop:2143 length:402 start_codon:yes stop_codon:yes gene_type:complete